MQARNSSTGPSPLRRVTLHEERPRLFWSLLFLLLFSGPPKFRIRDGGAGLYAHMDVALVLQAATFIVVGSILGFWMLRYRGAIQWYKAQKLTLLLIATFALSACVSDYPLYTLFRAFQVLVLFLFTAMYVGRFGSGVTLRSMLYSGLIVCAVDVACLFIIPGAVLKSSETGFPRFFGDGVAPTAEVAPILFALALSLRHRCRWLTIPCAATIAFFSLYRVAWVSIAALLVLPCILAPRIPNLRLLRAICFCTPVLIVLLGLPAQWRTVRDPATISDLSGRPEIWKFIAEDVIARSPILGEGYASASVELTGRLDPSLGYCHGVWMDIFAGSGVIGLSIFGAWLGTVLVTSIQLVRKARLFPTAYAAFSLCVPILLIGSIEADLNSGPFAFTLWCLASLLPAELANTDIDRCVLYRSGGDAEHTNVPSTSFATNHECV